MGYPIPTKQDWSISPRQDGVPRPHQTGMGYLPQTGWGTPSPPNRKWGISPRQDGVPRSHQTGLGYLPPPQTGWGTPSPPNRNGVSPPDRMGYPVPTKQHWGISPRQDGVHPLQDRMGYSVPTKQDWGISPRQDGVSRPHQTGLGYLPQTEWRTPSPPNRTGVSPPDRMAYPAHYRWYTSCSYTGGFLVKDSFTLSEINVNFIWSDSKDFSHLLGVNTSKQLNSKYSEHTLTPPTTTLSPICIPIDCSAAPIWSSSYRCVSSSQEGVTGCASFRTFWICAANTAVSLPGSNESGSGIQSEIQGVRFTTSTVT